MTIAERIKAARKAVGLTQKELGGRMGLSDASIAQYESGQRNPKMDTLQRIADALGVSITVFFDIETIEDAEDMANSVFPNDPEMAATVKRSMLEERLVDPKYDIFISAEEVADRAFSSAAKTISEGDLKRWLLEYFHYLNRRGKVEAVRRLREMEGSGEYKREDTQP